MRELLASLEGKRIKVKAKVGRFGKKSGWEGRVLRTLLLVDVSVSGKILTDHLWFTISKTFMKAELSEGDEVEFDARVTTYIKGYRGRNDFGEEGELSEDYKLAYPTHVINLTKPRPDPLEIPRTNQTLC